MTNGSMTKAELVEEVSRVSDLTKKHSEVIVDTVFKSIIDALHRGEKIELRGFGSFRLRKREPRKGRNPKTGDKVDVPPKKVPYFKPGKELKELINREADTPAGEPDNSRRREPQSPSAADISGRWSLNGGIMDFSPTERAGRYRFTELSSAAFLGANVPMGQGTATVTGNEATLVGQNQLMGPWSAEVSILGQQMQGTLSWFGNQVTFAMKRL